MIDKGKGSLHKIKEMVSLRNKKNVFSSQEFLKIYQCKNILDPLFLYLFFKVYLYKFWCDPAEQFSKNMSTVPGRKCIGKNIKH